MSTARSNPVLACPAQVLRLFCIWDDGCILFSNQQPHRLQSFL